MYAEGARSRGEGACVCGKGGGVPRKDGSPVERKGRTNVEDERDRETNGRELSPQNRPTGWLGPITGAACYELFTQVHDTTCKTQAAKSVTRFAMPMTARLLVRKRAHLIC